MNNSKKRFLVGAFVALAAVLLAIYDNEKQDNSIQLEKISEIKTSSIPDITIDYELEDDPANHTWNTIQEGIDNANESDVIYVRSGTYKENIAIYKQLTLIGEDNSSTIIDGGYEGDAVYIKANNVSLRGFRIINGQYRQSTSIATEIRGETADSSFTWTHENFGGLYYDIENDASGEMLKAMVSGRDIVRRNLIYTAAPQEVGFGYSPFGRYKVTGFMGEKYFSGYTANSSISDNKVISPLGSGYLHKVLLDDNRRRTVSESRALNLKDGYAISLRSVDTDGKAEIVLLKNGTEIDSAALQGNETYVYRLKNYAYRLKNYVNIDIIDLPVIAIHIDSITDGKGTDAAIIRGIFQISETYQYLKAGDKYGILTVTEISEDGIDMRNDIPVHLSKNDTIDIAGDIRFKVENSDMLRYYPFIAVNRSGAYEVRGRTARGTHAQTWDADSFSGFYYDPVRNIKPEKLDILGIRGRNIEKGSLIYQTSSVTRYFNIYKEKGILINGQTNYSVVGLGGETYVAVGGIANKIARILLDHGEALTDKKEMVSDETWDMGEGYTLTAQSVYSSHYSPRPPDREIWIKNKDGNYIGQARLTLRKDGRILKNETIPEGGAFIYSANLSNETNVPVFITYLDEVWGGTVMDHAVLGYTWLISQDVTDIKSGDDFGKLKVVNATAKTLIFENNYDISLNKGSIIPIIGDIKFRTSDSDELRYYPAMTGKNFGEETSGITIQASEKNTLINNVVLNSSSGIRFISTKDTPFVFG